MYCNAYLVAQHGFMHMSYVAACKVNELYFFVDFCVYSVKIPYLDMLLLDWDSMMIQ